MIHDDLPTKDALVEDRINRILTQYRESPKLKGLLRAVLDQAADVIVRGSKIPDAFWLDRATGDQLTLIGKRMGWPRVHRVTGLSPVFGFPYAGGGGVIPVGGFGNPWFDYGDIGSSEITISNDEVYRRFLKARRFQVIGQYDLDAVEQAAVDLFGPQAWVPSAAFGRVIVSIGRDLTEFEREALPLYAKVLPVPLAVRMFWDFGTSYSGRPASVSGGGGDTEAPVLSDPTATVTGGTTASAAVVTTETNGTLYWVATTSATPPSVEEIIAGQDHAGADASASGSQAVTGIGPFGFGVGWSGFGADRQFGWALVTEDGTLIVTEDGDQIITGEVIFDTPWIQQETLAPAP